MDKNKEKIKELKALCKKMWSITNNLIGDEDSYSKNQNLLQEVRENLDSIKLSLEFVKYKQGKDSSAD